MRLTRAIRSLAALLPVVVFGMTACDPPVPPTDVQLKVLVIGVGTPAEDPALDLVVRMLDRVGTPYDVLDASRQDLVPEVLSTTGHGNYNGIILSQADLFVAGGSAFDPVEWLILHDYERKYGVRESVVSGFPATDPARNLDYGMGAVGAQTGATGQWTGPAGGTELFEYVNEGAGLPITDYLVWGTPRNDGTGPAVTPLLVDQANPDHVFVSRLDYPDGRQVLLSTISNAWFLVHSNVLAYELLSFATGGVFIGGRHVYLSAHTDDLFLADELWDPVAKQTSLTESYRMSAHDVQATVATLNAFRSNHPLAADLDVQFSFNGSGVDEHRVPQGPVDRAIEADTTLDQSLPLVNAGQSTSVVVGRDGGGNAHNAVLRAADVSAPASIQRVDEVELALRLGSVSVADAAVEVCRVTEPWTEGPGTGQVLDLLGSSWTFASTGVPWGTSGGTIDPSSCVPGTISGAAQLRLDITPIWQAWVAGAPNHGVLVRWTDARTGEAVVNSGEAAGNTPVVRFTGSRYDDMTQAIIDNRADLRFINHTYRALQMDRLCPDPDEPQPPECPITDYATAYDEIARNRQTWQELDLPEYTENLPYLLSDSHAGLHDRMGTEEDPSDDIPYPDGKNENFLQAAFDLGIRGIASDSSRPNQDVEGYIPDFSPMVLLPRYPTNVYVNTTDPATNTDEYNWIYHGRFVAAGQDPCTIPGAICTPRTYQQILQAEADLALTHMLSYASFPHYFHQSNLRDYDGQGSSLQFDWLDAVMDRYEQLFTLPVRSPNAWELRQDAEDRIVAAGANVRGTLDLATGQITVVADSGATVLITGVAGGEQYGGQAIGRVAVGPAPQVLATDRGTGF